MSNDADDAVDDDQRAVPLMDLLEMAEEDMKENPEKGKPKENLTPNGEELVDIVSVEAAHNSSELCVFTCCVCGQAMPLGELRHQ